nr:chalcone--flavonone isomerase [Tanacetum cinerariifolium]
MEKLYSSTGIQFESVFIPPSIKPPSATKTLFLIGAGERHLEIHGNIVKITATGVYLEEKAIESLGIKWKGKTDVELMDSDEFYNDIYNVSLLKEELSHVPVWVKFHDVPLVSYASDGLSLMVTKIDTHVILDSYTNFMCLESWGRSSYARIHIEINACNDFSDHLVMKLGGNNGGTKNFMVSVKPKTQYHLQAKQSIDGTSNSPKTTPFVGTTMASTSGYNKESPSNKATGSKATTSSTQDEGKSSTPIVDKINLLEKQILKGKLVFVDEDGKPPKKVDYPDNLGNDDEAEQVDLK